jgi:hypothetical protein
MVELIQKQASKRFISLMMKAVPGLNFISLAVDIYDVYSLASDISAAYMEASTELEIDAELELLIANSNVAIDEMPEIIPTFFYGIGAGGKITELKPKNVDELEAFFNMYFPEVESSTKFINFMFNYGDFYQIKKNKIENIEGLIESVRKYKENYNEERISQEGEVIELNEEDFNDAEGSNFFREASYAIREGIPKKLGDIVKVDAMGIYTDSEGNESQINVPDKKLIELVVTKIPDGETVILKTKNDFVLTQDITPKLAKLKRTITLLLRKDSIFIYNKNTKSITRK